MIDVRQIQIGDKIVRKDEGDWPNETVVYKITADHIHVEWKKKRNGELKKGSFSIDYFETDTKYSSRWKLIKKEYLPEDLFTL